MRVEYYKCGSVKTERKTISSNVCLILVFFVVVVSSLFDIVFGSFSCVEDVESVLQLFRRLYCQSLD